VLILIIADQILNDCVVLTNTTATDVYVDS